jgi:hypothetical protein
VTAIDGVTGGVHEPLTRALQTVLRRAVADHAAREPRRVYPPLLHVGWPGGPEDVFVVAPDEQLDHALRTDVVAALLHTSRRRAPVTGGPDAGGRHPPRVVRPAHRRTA